MSKQTDKKKWGIDRRTVLKGAAVGVGLGAMPGLATAGKPCFKDFECEEGTYVKFEFVIEYDDEGNIICYFEEETDTDLITIESFESKTGETCEPISVEWSVADGYYATKVMAYGGTDCITVEDLDSTGGTFKPELENSGGNTAAISNLQFCVEELVLEEVCVDDFEDLEAGDEIGGDTLNGVTITSANGGKVVAAKEGEGPKFYGAPNGDESITNGCMGEKVDVGFGDIDARNNAGPQDLDFDLENPVKEFELRMLDYGDFNPDNDEHHLVEITAFDGNGGEVDSETIEYWTDSGVNPETAYETSSKENVLWDDLYEAGDACDAEAGEPGDYTFELAGEEIERVELRFGDGNDPNIAFDLPCITKEVIPE